MKLQHCMQVSIITLAGLALFSSCQKESTPAPFTSSTPLQALIIGDTTLTVYNAAVQKSGEFNVLFSSIDSITVLMPTNQAFLSQGITLSTISAMSVAQADSLVRYHFVASSANLATGSYTSFNSQLGPAVYGYGNTDGSNNYFNGSIAIKQTLAGSNATVYKVSTPLQVPYASMSQLLASDTSLTYFAEAVNHTGLSLVPVSGWNTILTPDNNSFIAAGYTTLGSIDSANVNTMMSILQYHIIPGQFFSNNFIGLATVGSSEGNSINLTFGNAMPQFTGTGNISAASVTWADRIAGTNTVVQKINGLLMPQRSSQYVVLSTQYSDK